VPLAEWMAQRPMPYSSAELCALFSRQRLRDAVTAGTVTRILPDCYVSSQYRDSFHARCAAALHWLGAPAAIGSTSALYLWQLMEDEPEVVTAVVPHATRRSTPSWLRLYRTHAALPTSTINGWTVVEAQIALAQGYGALSAYTRSRVLHRAFAWGHVSAESMVDACENLPRVRRRGELLRRVDRILGGAESYLEEYSVAHVFNTADFEDLVPQFTVRVEGRIYRLDLYDVESRTAVELDGARFHSDAESRRRDVRRDADLASVGILTVRFSYADLMNRPQWCRQRLAAILQVRTRTPQ